MATLIDINAVKNNASNAKTITYNGTTLCKLILNGETLKELHNYTTKTVAPLCLTQGYTRYSCTRCNDYYDDLYTAALGHDYYYEITTVATCTTTGTSTGTCSRCSKKTTSTIAALGHNFVAGTVVAPTCSAQGYTNYKCSRCTSSYKGDYTAIDSSAHSWGSGVVTSPTCTAQGYTTYTCTLCGTTKKENYKSAKGHTYGDWTIVTQATMTTAGSKKRTCSVCGNVETATIPAIELSYTLNSDGNTYSVGAKSGSASALGKSLNLGTAVDVGDYAYECVLTIPFATATGGMNNITLSSYTGFRSTPSIKLYTDYVQVSGYAATAGRTCSATVSYLDFPTTNTVLTIPETYNGKSITKIANNGFRNCTGITALNPYDRCAISEIGYGAFSGCTSLSDLGELIGGVDERIGSYAFYGCTGLTGSITLSAEVIDADAFGGCSNITSIIDYGSSSIGYHAFYGCSKMTSYTRKNAGLEEIGAGAFSNCSALTSVDLGYSYWYQAEYDDYDDVTCTYITASSASTTATYLKSTYNDNAWYKFYAPVVSAVLNTSSTGVTVTVANNNDIDLTAYVRIAYTLASGSTVKTWTGSVSAHCTATALSVAAGATFVSATVRVYFKEFSSIASNVSVTGTAVKEETSSTT